MLLFTGVLGLSPLPFTPANSTLDQNGLSIAFQIFPKTFIPSEDDALDKIPLFEIPKYLNINLHPNGRNLTIELFNRQEEI